MTSKQSTPADTKLERKLEAFAEYLCARRGLAECTIHGYVGAIRRLSPSIGLNPPHPVLDALIVKMRKAGASYSHVVNTSLALERYTEFIGNPIHLGRPKKPKRMIRGTLTEAEITLMLAACRNIREKAILTLLAYSGIRNKELCGLKIGDVDVASQLIHVYRGKGQKDRDASIAPPCAGVLLERRTVTMRLTREEHAALTERARLPRGPGLSLPQFIRTLLGFHVRQTSMPGSDQRVREEDEAWDLLQSLGLNPQDYFES
jgi:integrase